MTNWELGTVVGSDGTDGKGIVSITKTGTSGLVDTYTITYTDGTSTTFTVTNGESGTADIVTSWESTLSDEKVPSEKLTKNSIDGKADSVHTHTKSQITDFPSLATVATSGDYDDLTDKPTIPSKTSDLTNDGDGTNAFLTTHQDISGKLNISQTSYKGKNVVVDSSTGDITFENKPTIPTKTSDLNNDSGFITSSSISGMLTTSDIVNDLTTGGTTKVLSAEQGKELATMIGTAISYIQQ